MSFELKTFNTEEARDFIAKRTLGPYQSITRTCVLFENGQCPKQKYPHCGSCDIAMSDHGVLGVLLEEQGLSTLGPLQCYDDLRVLESIFQSGKEAVQIDHWGGNVRIESIASAGEGLCRLRYIGDTLGI